jgi:hypothetical protein
MQTELGAQNFEKIEAKKKKTKKNTEPPTYLQTQFLVPESETQLETQKDVLNKNRRRRRTRTRSRRHVVVYNRVGSG